MNAIGGGAPSVMVGNTTPAFTNSTPGGTWSITNGTGSATINASGIATGVSTGTVTVNYSVTVNGCTTVVTTVLTITAFIPIELMEFSAACVDEKVILKWRTALERNNDFYTIEKSFDASLWEEIGFVDGAGTTSSVNHYEFIDETEAWISDLASSIFYRLKQTDFDGQSGYYGPLSVSCISGNDWNLLIINPVSDALTGTLYAAEESEAVLEIFDLQGRIIHREKINVVNGSNLLQMDITSLVNGFYFIKAYNEKKNILCKFVR